ncbi:MAG: hypothetical protein WB952_01280 [Terriglobales bacterium]
MREQVHGLGYERGLENVKPTNLSNVRFFPSQVKFYDPYVEVPRQYKKTSLTRYQLVKVPMGTDTSWFVAQKPEQRKHKSESPRTRAACEGTVYDPVHDHIQNALDRLLRHKFGHAAVSYESGHVDLTLEYKLGTRHKVAFFEVKTEPTVKQCIRAAVGQLLEYSYYPSDARADELIVVGWALPEPKDVQYLRHLSRKFALPLGYWCFDTEKRVVTKRIGVAGLQA